MSSKGTEDASDGEREKNCWHGFLQNWDRRRRLRRRRQQQQQPNHRHRIATINKVRDSRLTAEFFSVLFCLYFSPIFFSSVPWQQRFRRLRRCRRRRCCCCCRCAPQTLNNRIKLRPPLRQQPMANRGTAPARLKSPRLSTEKDGLIGRETPAIIRQSCIKMHRAGTDSRKCEKPFGWSTLQCC